MLLLVLALGTFGCKRSDTAGKDDAQTPDAKDDGVLTVDDYDSTATYAVPDYTTMNMEDYITLGSYRGLTLTLDYDAVTVSDSELQSEIAAILKEYHPGAKITDRAVAWGDTVVADYVGTLDGVAFEGGSATEQTLELKDNSGYIPGFVEGLVGAMPGQEYPVDVTFPEDYHSADLAGKAVVFTFTVHYIEGTPELDDAFVIDHTNGEYTTAADYREAVREGMAEHAYEQELQSVLWQRINENATVKQYPVDAVMYYYDYQYKIYSYYAAMYGLDYETFCLYYGVTPAQLFEYCKEMVKEDLVYCAVLAAGGYSYTDEQYERALEQYTSENYEALREQMMADGEQDYTYEQAKEYFHQTQGKQLITQCMEENMYADLTAQATIVIGEPSESAS